MTGFGAALAGTGLVWLAGLGVFALACRLSAAEPRGPRDTRRIAAWQRGCPWATAVGVAVVTVGLVLLSTI
ncbi:hypothetical protein FHS29_006707 [Saccharothrix tamanrassetensis]|uniref:Uncharacterized protein n=1 Tax=Saccharothrix tamanrassetensis TaxID=1051531 RepID=A0A841CUU0_9PSEU|nr:hypothetical protein [Saccharothrix tamanrassetensis]MBB5960084.1 hypothetical protein [Saccharothrix tamanrassetensis]